MNDVELETEEYTETPTLLMVRNRGINLSGVMEWTISYPNGVPTVILEYGPEYNRTFERDEALALIAFFREHAHSLMP